jgi:hypothetical protein
MPILLELSWSDLEFPQRHFSFSSFACEDRNVRRNSNGVRKDR